MKKILILSANPRDTARLRLDEEVREIEDGLRLSEYRNQFDIRQRWAVRLRDLRRTMLYYKPNIVHFCGHGEEDGLMVEDEHGNATLVSSDALSELFELLSDQVECVLLNACYSQTQAEAIARHINYVIGMSKGIDDRAAIEFAVGFYDALGAGKSYKEAFKFGRNAIQLYNIPKHLTPILKKKSSSLVQHRKRLILVLSATIDDVNRQKVEAIVEHLRQISGDLSLTLEEVLSGSVILIIECSFDGYNTIISLFKKGELTKVSDIPVLDIQSEVPIKSEPGTQQKEKRFLDAAIPEQVVVNEETELITMIRTPDSRGLREVLKEDLQLQTQPQDVKSKDFELRFPLDERGNVTFLDLWIDIETNDFILSTRQKKIRVYPSKNSEYCIFLLTPRKKGLLKLIIHVKLAETVIATGYLQVNGHTKISEGLRVLKTLITLPLAVFAIGAKAKSPFTVSESEKRESGKTTGEGKMVLPFQLQQKIVDFLTSLPNMHDSDRQRALIFHAGLDSQLQDQISFGGPSVDFVSLLVSTLINYGKLDDGRNALEAVLEAAKGYVGQGKRDYCDPLIQELDTHLEKQEHVSSVEKGLRALLEHMHQDLMARKSELQENSSIPSKQWFVQEVSRCNVGEHYYINRLVKGDGKSGRLAKKFKHWLEEYETSATGEYEPQPYLFVVGPSGIGKTNFLIAEVIAPIVKENITLIENAHPPKEAIVFFRLGSYNPKRSFWLNFEELVNRRMPTSERITKEIFRTLVQNGRILLILDGLDEFMRVHGEDYYGVLVGALQEIVDHTRSKIIISCRNHIYKRLKGKPLFKQRSIKVIKIDQLRDYQVKEILKKRLGEESKGYRVLTDPKRKLHKFARRPLLLEMMCEIPEDAWSQLRDECHAADLYDLWFEEIIRKHRKEEMHLRKVASAEIRKRIGEIAMHMLADRSDLLHESIYREEKLLPTEIDSRKQKLLGIFIKQTETDWSFVHDSFREFSLAKKFADELLSGEYDFLKRTSSFDYLNAEIYEFVYQVLQARGGYVDPIKQALESNTSYTEEEWNNIVRNCFEAIGMIADDDLERLEASTGKPSFIQIAIEFLCFPSGSASTALSYKTKYNIVRALARLHLSGPERPYCKHNRSIDWKTPPSLTRFGTWVVQGFHRKTQIVRLFPPTIFRTAKNDCSNKHQEEVSKCLISLLQASVDQTAPEDEKRDCRFLRVNASFALIRWLHKDHLDKLKESLEHVQSDLEIKGNLFLALFRLGDKDIFKDFPHYFDGMKLRWVPDEVANTAIGVGYKEYDIEIGTS